MLLPASLRARAVSSALPAGGVLASNATLQELADVLGKPKFDQYVSIDDRKAFFNGFCRIAQTVEIVRRIAVCRDSNDDKYLELAVNGEADYLVTGDEDLLVLNPFEKVKILTPQEFLQLPNPGNG